MSTDPGTHPDTPTLHAYLRGALPNATAIAVDRHVGGCHACRDAFASSAAAGSGASMRRVLTRIEREGGHLTFENLAAITDGTLPAARRSLVERHLGLCGRCRRELADMRAFAPVLSKPLKAPTVEAKVGFLDRLRHWFGSGQGLGASAAALIAASAAALVISGHPGSRGGGSVDAAFDDKPSTSVPSQSKGASHAADAGPAGVTAGPRDIAAFAVFGRIDRIAPEALNAYRARDYATVAKALQVRVGRREAGAAHALGLLYAEGLGVPVDRARALTLLQRAAAQGDADAAHDLATIEAGH